MNRGKLVFTQLMQHLPLTTFVSGSVSDDGIRPADLSRKSARYRSVSARPTLRAVSVRHSLDDRTQYPGKRGSRLAHLCRFFAELDRHRSPTVCTRALWCRSERVGLRGNIPTFIHISDDKRHEVNLLDQLLLEAGTFYLMVEASSTSSVCIASTKPAAS